jgi:hypothetical protein
LRFTSHRHNIGHIKTFQLNRWVKTSGDNECYGDGIDDHTVDENDDNDDEVMMSWMMILKMMTYSTDDI